eukprot:6445177-Alexandrium_andersonii.AAC.1
MLSEIAERRKSAGGNDVERAAPLTLAIVPKNIERAVIAPALQGSSLKVREGSPDECVFATCARFLWRP